MIRSLGLTLLAAADDGLASYTKAQGPRVERNLATLARIAEQVRNLPRLEADRPTLPMSSSYREYLPREAVQLLDLGDPDPEDREHFWSFGSPRVGDSSVVPTGTRPSMPLASCSSSESPFRSRVLFPRSW